MTGLIRADLRRVLRKKSFWIWMVLFFLFQVSDFISAVANESTAEEIVQQFQRAMSGRFLLIVTIFIYLVIFGDDARSNTEIYVLGRGMSKGRYLASKLLTCIILAGIYYGFLTVLRQILFWTSDVQMISARQLRLLGIYSIFMVIRALWCLSFALLLQQIFGNTAPAILSIAVTAFLSAPLLKTLQFLYRIDLYSYLPDGLLEAALLNCSSGTIPWQLAVVLILYIGGPLLAASIIFQKKEPEL